MDKDGETVRSETEWRELDRGQLEAMATGLSAGVDIPDIGQARAELLRRDRRYAEQQEQSRRVFEWEATERQLLIGKRAMRALRLSRRQGGTVLASGA